MPINTANATWLSGDDDDDDVEPRLCDCPKFVPWHRGPAEYNLTTTNLLLPSHFEGVWGIPPAAGGKQELSNSHYKPLGLIDWSKVQKKQAVFRGPSRPGWDSYGKKTIFPLQTKKRERTDRCDAQFKLNSNFFVPV